MGNQQPIRGVSFDGEDDSEVGEETFSQSQTDVAYCLRKSRLNAGTVEETFLDNDEQLTEERNIETTVAVVPEEEEESSCRGVYRGHAHQGSKENRGLYTTNRNVRGGQFGTGGGDVYREPEESDGGKTRNPSRPKKKRRRRLDTSVEAGTLNLESPQTLPEGQEGKREDDVERSLHVPSSVEPDLGSDPVQFGFAHPPKPSESMYPSRTLSGLSSSSSSSFISQNDGNVTFSSPVSQTEAGPGPTVSAALPGFATTASSFPPSSLLRSFPLPSHSRGTSDRVPFHPLLVSVSGRDTVPEGDAVAVRCGSGDSSFVDSNCLIQPLPRIREDVYALVEDPFVRGKLCEIFWQMDRRLTVQSLENRELRARCSRLEAELQYFRSAFVGTVGAVPPDHREFREQELFMNRRTSGFRDGRMNSKA
jgi:hypothetical protein